MTDEADMNIFEGAKLVEYDLPAKLKLFAVLYAETGNETHCAKYFKVPKKQIKIWLRMPQVAQIIQKELEAFASVSLVSKFRLEGMALDVYDKAMGTGMTKKQKEDENFQPSLTNANQAVTILAKMNDTERKFEASANETGATNITLNISTEAFNSNQHLEAFNKVNEKLINPKGSNDE